MSTTGSTALIRLASNPSCEILGAMVMQGGSEARFYQQATGELYDREFGERQSSRRRGSQFEQSAYAGDARLLREALVDIVGLPADDIRVRNLMDDYPGTKEDARIARLKRTRDILKSSPSANSPHLVIQPQLLVPTKPGQRPYFFLAPDFLVWSRAHQCYVVGDLKSFVVRENEVKPSDLARVRLQLGAQCLALRHEYDRIDAKASTPNIGLLVFSQPNGLRPHKPRTEEIGGAIEAIRIGIAAYLRHRDKIMELEGTKSPHSVVDELTPHFQDACLSSCVMAQWCRSNVAGTAADLGDAAKDVLGEVEIERLIGLMNGSITPTTDQEALLASELMNIDQSKKKVGAA